MNSDAPIWVDRARSEHIGNDPTTTAYSELGRSMQNALIFNSCADYHGHIESIGVIGVGFDASLTQSIHPHVLHASACRVLQSAPLCTFVDIDSRILEVFRSEYLYGIIDTDAQRKVWEEFVGLTGEHDRNVREIDPSLPAKDARFIEKCLQTGSVRSIPVPALFREGLRKGKIRLVCADVSEAGWSEPGQLDYIDCSYLLNHLHRSGQKLAMWQMKKSLRPGGLLMVTDIVAPNGTLSENGGWLSDAELADLGLSDITAEINPPRSDMYVFQSH